MKQYQVGFFGGSFCPLHLGHVNNIIKAASSCKKLYLVLSYNETESIDHQTRFMWLKQVTETMENVIVLECKDTSTRKEEYDWEAGYQAIQTIIPEPIDVIFCGSDYRTNQRFQKLWKDCEKYYIDRNTIPISSKRIRENPYKYYEYLPDFVKPYYTKKVVVLGTESCGKSTLVKNLAKAYNTTYVEEIGREVCEEAGGIDNMQRNHYYEILIRHQANILEQIKHANKLLFVDTESLVTLYYYQLGYHESIPEDKTFKKLAINIAKLNPYDLYIYLEPDVPWVQDGTRTYGEDTVRETNNCQLKQLLTEQEIPYHIIDGTYEQRYERSKVLINKYLKEV